MVKRGLIILSILVGAGFLIWSFAYQLPEMPEERQKPEKRELTNSDINQTLDQPKRFAGWPVNIDGQVAKDPEYDGEGTHMQVYLVSGTKDSYVVVDYPATLEKAAGDFINIKGRVGDIFVGRTDDGQELKTIRIKAAKIATSSPEKALAPAIKVLKTKMKRAEGDVSITVDRVEFATVETRFYIKLRNRGSQPVIVHLFNSYVESDGKLLSLQPNRVAGYKEVPIDLPGGAQTEGVLVFPAMDPNAPVELILGISGHGWEKEFKFDLSK